MRFLVGFLIGMIIGVVAVLLTTPQSGKDLQDKTRTRFDDIMSEGRKAAAERRAELESRLTDLKSGGGGVTI
jgi:gas vesicle protein